MRNISDTIARLNARRTSSLQPANTVEDRLSDLRDFGSNPGALRGRFYVPASLSPSVPLVVVLHGCTQTAAGYDHGSGWSRLADRAGFALLFPEQQRANNPNLCFNWFVPSDTTRGAGEALSIRQMIEAMIGTHGLDHRRIFVTGLSAGGAMAAVMLAAYPELFAGGAIIAGLPYGTAGSVPEAFDRMRGHGGPSEAQLQALLRNASPHAGPWPTISIWHGSVDKTVAVSNADATAAQWRAVHGVAASPSRSENRNGHLRRIWTDAKGNDVIEINTIVGMGHGTPLRTTGAEGLGNPGPFMLEVGISSTRKSARFFGIVPSAVRDHDIELAANAGHSAYVDERPAGFAGALASGRPVASNDAPGQKTPTSVQDTIESALRAAGLMR